MRYRPVTEASFRDTPGLERWRCRHRCALAELELESFSAAAELAARIARAADAADHHPDVDLRYPGRVRVRLTTQAIGQLSDHDVALARTISSLADEVGARWETPTRPTLEMSIAADDARGVAPFWAAVLGYRDLDGVVVDPDGDGPTLTFGPVEPDAARTASVRLRVLLRHDRAARLVEDACAAGGRLVTPLHDPDHWQLADPAGNIVEVAASAWD